jgi:hypothetical protein
MKLRVFRSLKDASTTRLTTTSGFDGIVATMKEKISLNTTCSSNQHQRWICQLHPKNALEAAIMLDRLRSHHVEDNAAPPPDMIVFHHSTMSSQEDSLPFLREMLPLGAQFLEDHNGRIAKNYGRLNAHGRPLNGHVVGICHHFSNHSVPDLAVLLDVFLPTRLALSASNMFREEATAAYDDDALEAVVQNTDLLYGGDLEDKNNGIWTEVWKAQRQDGAKETYAICNNEEEVELLRQSYSHFLEE